MTDELTPQEQRLVDLGFELAEDRHDAEGTTEITLYGEPRVVPEAEEPVALRIEDGSWVEEGYRAISGPVEHDGEQVVWITTEAEYSQAQVEGREAGGQPWPIEAVSALDEEVSDLSDESPPEAGR